MCMAEDDLNHMFRLPKLPKTRALHFKKTGGKYPTLFVKLSLFRSLEHLTITNSHAKVSTECFQRHFKRLRFNVKKSNSDTRSFDLVHRTGVLE